MNDDRLTITEAAAALGWARWSVRCLVVSGRVPGAVLEEDSRGPVWKIPRASLGDLEPPRKGWPRGRPKPAETIRRRLETLRKRRDTAHKKTETKRRKPATVKRSARKRLH